MSAPRHTFLDSQGLPIHCLEWGDSEGAPLILVHGYLDLAESWRAFVDALQTRQRNLWVIAPDCRGHGDSGWIGAGGYYHFPDMCSISIVSCERTASTALRSLAIPWVGPSHFFMQAHFPSA